MGSFGITGVNLEATIILIVVLVVGLLFLQPVYSAQGPGWFQSRIPLHTALSEVERSRSRARPRLRADLIVPRGDPSCSLISLSVKP